MVPSIPQITRRSFLRSSSAVTTSTILAGLGLEKAIASPGPPPPTSATGALVEKPAYHNIQSSEVTITWIITWELPNGQTRQENVIEVVPAGGTAPSRTIYDKDAIRGTISDPQ